MQVKSKVEMSRPLKIKAQVSSIWAKGCMFDDCVCYLTWHDYYSLVEGESHGILFIIIFLIIIILNLITLSN